MNRKITLLILGFISLSLYAQTSLYQWRDQLPYAEGRKIAVSKDKVYCLSVGGLFALNMQNNSLEKLSKISGLSDVDFSTIAYSESNNSLIIGYSDGNIDVLIDNVIYNISDIKRASIIGSKAINNITFKNELAYLSCGFGIVVLDIQNREINATYYIGDNGDQLIINDITLGDIYIYAATQKGIYRADINSSNLIDFNAWERISFIPNYTENFNCIVSFNNKTYVNRPDTSGNDIVYEIDGNNWSSLNLSLQGSNYDLFSNDNYLLISNSTEVLFYDKTGKIVRTIDDNVYWNPKPRAVVFSDNVAWLADDGQGLIKVPEDNKKYFYLPNGPKSKEVFNIDIKDNNVWVAGGSPYNPYNHTGGYSFQNEKWSSYNRIYDNNIWDIANFSEVIIDPKNTSHAFFGSYGSGLVEYLNNQFVKLYDQSNSVLENVSGFAEGYINIVGLVYDANNNLWIATNFAENPVYVKPEGKDIIKIDFEYTGFSSNQRIGDIIVTQNNNKWILLGRKGIFVFDNQPEQGVYHEKFFQVKNRDGEIISNQVMCLAEDLKGNIWVGTDKGPVVYYNPENVFDENIEMYATQVLIPRNDGTDLADILLETETINKIVVDGADRKWMATQNSGAFLISKDGTNEIYNFNVENSPIFSNTILCLDINDETGEVFFGTDKGIVSFKSTATKGNEDFNNVYTYPNPVRETYQGDITITGLVDNVNVKITDIAGNIVFETNALGGQAIWNGENFDGRRVQTGVYLVFCSNDDGSKTFVTKILFIN